MSREARNQRRAAERKAKKLERKRLTAEAGNQFVSQNAPGPEPAQFVSQSSVAPVKPARFVSQDPLASDKPGHSTGPRTPEGKLASSRNSLKHGLASSTLIIPGEDRAEFDALLDALLQDHQPANSTEQLLVEQMAQSHWLMQRALRLQNECFTENGVDEKRLALFLRYQTTHGRAFYAALNLLIRLKKDRSARGLDEAALLSEPKTQTEFVSQKHAAPSRPRQFVSQNASGLDAEPQFVSQNDRNTHYPARSKLAA